jgi:hypothetical protein
MRASGYDLVGPSIAVPRNLVYTGNIFMFRVALAAGLSEPTATPAAAVAGGAGGAPGS